MIIVTNKRWVLVYLNSKADGFGFSHLRFTTLGEDDPTLRVFIRWMWFLPVGGLPCGWPVARVTPAWWNCCFQLELTKIKWNSTWMAGPIWWKEVFQGLGWEMQSHIFMFSLYFSDWRGHILVLPFSDRKSSKRPNPKSTTFQDFRPGWNITISFSRMIHLYKLITMDVPFFGAMFVARRLQMQGTCQHVQGESQGHAINKGQLFLFCIEFASCPCRHESGSQMARHLCMQLANLGSNTKGFSEMMWDPKPVLTDLMCYRLIIWKL